MGHNTWYQEEPAAKASGSRGHDRAVILAGRLTEFTPLIPNDRGGMIVDEI